MISGIVKVVAVVGAGGLLAGAVALGATNGGGDSVPAVQVAEETRTSVPEGPATAEPEQTPDNQRPVIPRTDCLPDKNAYEDPDGRFSLCYPKTGIRASTHEPQGGAKRTVLTLREPPDYSIVNAWKMIVAWDRETGYNRGAPSPENCKNYINGIETITSQEYVEAVVDGRRFTGCVVEGVINPDGVRIRATKLLLPLAGDGGASEGFLIIEFRTTGPNFQATEGKTEALTSSFRIR